MSARYTPNLAALPLREHLPAPGSDLYYALLYQPPASRAALTLIESLRRSISGVVLGSTQPELAETRLHWWHTELHALADGVARHPLLVALQPLSAEHAGLLPAFFALVEGLAQQLRHPRYAEVGERHALLLRTHGPLWDLHGELAGLAGTAVLPALRELGCHLEFASLLRDLRRAVTGGFSVLSQDHAPPAERRGQAAEDHYAAWVGQELRWLRRELENAAHAVTRAAPGQPSLRCARTLASLAARTLAEIEADGAGAWTRRLELTPIRKLWLALKVRAAT